MFDPCSLFWDKGKEKSVLKKKIYLLSTINGNFRAYSKGGVDGSQRKP